MSTDTRPRSRRLVPALAAAALPAYVLPASQAFAAGWFTGDDRLATAAYTTIAGASAAAAVLVALVLHRRTPPALPTFGTVLRAVIVSALASAALAAAVTAALVGNGVADSILFLDAAPSAAIGGGITAAVWARSGRPRKRARKGGNSATTERGATASGRTMTNQLVAAQGGAR